MPAGRGRSAAVPPTVVAVTDATDFAGAERYLVTLARHARSLGRARVLVVAPEDAPSAATFASMGIDVTTVPGLGRRPRPATVAALRRVVRAEAASALLVNLTDQGDNGSALVAGRLLGGVRSLGVLHLWIPDAPRVRRPAYRAMLAGTDRLATPGQGTADALSSLGLEAEVVPNGMDVADLVDREEARRRLGVAPGAVLVGGIGRITAQKGWDLLVDAWPAVEGRHAGVCGVVIGDGEDRAQLDARSAGSLRFVGPVPDAARLLTAFDLLVAPSRFESHALVPIEAALAGVPAVLSDVGGLREADGPGVGFVAPDDAGALALGIVAALGDLGDRRRQALDGRASQARRYDPAAMTARTLELLGVG